MSGPRLWCSAVASLALVGCSDLADGAGGVVLGEGEGCLVSLNSEFGVAGTVDLVDLGTAQVVRHLTTVHHDSLLRVFGERVFVVQRLGADAILELDLRRSLAVVRQFALPAGSNPSDLALLADGTVLVTLLGEGSVVHLDWRLPRPEVLGKLSFAPHADADGSAEPVGLLVTADASYAVLQRLEDHRCSAGQPLIVQLPETIAGDSASLPVLPLARCNPVSWARLADGRWAIGSAGLYRNLAPFFPDEALEDDGGVELVDLEQLTSDGLIATEADLGDRDPIRLRASGDELLVAASDAEFSVEVLRLDSAPDAQTEHVVASGSLFDFLPSAGGLLLAERAWNGFGVRWSGSADASAWHVATSLPPFELGMVRGLSCLPER